MAFSEGRKRGERIGAMDYKGTTIFLTKKRSGPFRKGFCLSQYIYSSRPLDGIDNFLPSLRFG